MKPNHSNITSSPPPSSSAPTSSQHKHLFNLSDFDRINRIGSGFRGTLYKVLHRPTATHFALKVIYDGDHDVRHQIFHEIKILHGIDNLNIVKCYDHMLDRDGENIHVLVEYMDGGSLQGTHLSDESNLADVTRQILSGLYYLHRRNIKHRHIKPSNLLINSKKQVKIGVLGVSRILQQTTHPCNYSVSTIAYMSPERINMDLNKGEYDDGCAGDIWSVGVCILELYRGVLPFEIGRQGDWGRLMWTICMSPPPKAPTTASPEFQHFVGCCLHKDPARRWTAAQLLCHPFIAAGAAIIHEKYLQSKEVVLTKLGLTSTDIALDMEHDMEKKFVESVCTKHNTLLSSWEASSGSIITCQPTSKYEEDLKIQVFSLEEELRQNKEKLKQSEEKYEKIYTFMISKFPDFQSIDCPPNKD